MKKSVLRHLIRTQIRSVLSEALFVTEELGTLDPWSGEESETFILDTLKKIISLLPTPVSSNLPVPIKVEIGGGDESGIPRYAAIIFDQIVETNKEYIDGLLSEYDLEVKISNKNLRFDSWKYKNKTIVGIFKMQQLPKQI